MDHNQEPSVSNDPHPTLLSQLTTAFTIDWYMSPAKITYFLANGIDGAFKPYALSFLVGVGLNKAEAGLVTGLRLLGMTFAGPLWGFITDKRQNHVLILILMALMSIVWVGGQPLLSIWIGDQWINTCPAPLETNTTSSGSATLNEANSTINFRSTRLIIFLFVNILASCFDGCIITLVDAGVVKRIRASPTPKEFGWNRMFGTFGFSTGSFLSGLVSDMFPYTEHVNCFTGAYVVLSCFLLGLVVVCPYLFKLPENKVNPYGHEMRPPALDVQPEGGFDDVFSNEVIKPETNKSLTGLLFKTLKNVEMIIFLSTVLIVGTLQGVLISFTTLRIKELNGPTSLAGFVVSIVALSSLPSMTLASRLIHLFKGYWGTFFTCCTIYAISFITMGHIKNPWLAIPICAFVGFGVGLMIVTPVLYIKSNTDPKIHTTMLSIRTTTFFGFGFIIANIVGGQIVSRYGGSQLFFCSGLLAVGWNLVLLIVIGVKALRRNERENVTYGQTF